MTYLEFEKEYNEGRPTEPYFEDDVGWSNIAHYAEDNLQRAFNLGYCECFHESEKIIEDLLDLLKNEAYRVRCYPEMERAVNFLKKGK